VEQPHFISFHFCLKSNARPFGEFQKIETILNKKSIVLFYLVKYDIIGKKRLKSWLAGSVCSNTVCCKINSFVRSVSPCFAKVTVGCYSFRIRPTTSSYNSFNLSFST
jgi:hypothetical protein